MTCYLFCSGISKRSKDRQLLRFPAQELDVVAFNESPFLDDCTCSVHLIRRELVPVATKHLTQLLRLIFQPQIVQLDCDPVLRLQAACGRDVGPG